MATIVMRMVMSMRVILKKERCMELVPTSSRMEMNTTGNGKRTGWKEKVFTRQPMEIIMRVFSLMES